MKIVLLVLSVIFARLHIRDLQGITDRGNRGITAVKYRGIGEWVPIFTAVAAVMGTAV